MGLLPRPIPVLVVLATVILQVSVVQQIGIGHASPDLAILVIISFALLSGSIAGASYGFIGGLAIALCAALPLGAHALVATVIGYWAGRWGEVLVNDEHPAPPIIAGIVGTMAMQIGRPLCEVVLVPGSHALSGMWTGAVLVTAFNALLAVPVYAVCRRVDRAARHPESTLDAHMGEA